MIHKEHIVIIESEVCNECRGSEETENAETDGEVSPFKALHAGNRDIKRSEAGDAVSDSGNYVVDRYNGIACVILRCANSAEDRAENTEDNYEIKRSLLKSSLGESRKRNGDKLNAAKEERKKCSHLGEAAVVNTNGNL